jgi:hypothetical protein
LQLGSGLAPDFLANSHTAPLEGHGLFSVGIFRVAQPTEGFLVVVDVPESMSDRRLDWTIGSA